MQSINAFENIHVFLNSFHPTSISVLAKIKIGTPSVHLGSETRNFPPSNNLILKMSTEAHFLIFFYARVAFRINSFVSSRGDKCEILPLTPYT